jgi:hypothetical protein
MARRTLVSLAAVVGVVAYLFLAPTSQAHRLSKSEAQYQARGFVYNHTRGFQGSELGGTRCLRLSRHRFICSTDLTYPSAYGENACVYDVSVRLGVHSWTMYLRQLHEITCSMD